VFFFLPLNELLAQFAFVAAFVVGVVCRPDI
jgi:hypothetical protein